MPARRLAFVAVVAAACGSNAKPPEKPVKPDVVAPPVAKPKTVAEVFLIDCRAGLATAKQLLPDIIAVTDPRSVDNTLAPLNALYTELANVAAKASLYRALATAEDRHRDTFLELAAVVAPDAWRARLDALALAEAEIIARLPVRARIH